MTAPIPQLDIEAEIQRLSVLLEKQTHAVATRAKIEAEADAAYDVRYHQAFLTAKLPDTGKSPSDETCKAKARVQCAEEYATFRGAQAVLRSAENAGRNLRAQLDALRSLNANVRAQVTGG